MAYLQSRTALAIGTDRTENDANRDQQQEDNGSKTQGQEDDQLAYQADIDDKLSEEDSAANSGIDEASETLSELSISSTRILKDHPKNKKEVEEEDALALTMALSYSEVSKDIVPPILDLENVTNLILKGNCKVRKSIKPSHFALMPLILIFSLLLECTYKR